MASVICQLVESDDTLRTIFFGTMSSLQPFYNHTVSLSTSAYLPGPSPVATTRQKVDLPGYAAASSQTPRAPPSLTELQEQKPSNSTSASILRSWRENASRIWQGHLASGAYIPYSQDFSLVLLAREKPADTLNLAILKFINTHMTYINCPFLPLTKCL